MANHFELRIAGASADRRTNRWKAKCVGCGKEHEPPTTLLAKQDVECPKCGAIEIVNYNDEMEHQS